MNILIIHHLQMMWDLGLQKYGTNFKNELLKVYNHLKNENYDKVIITNFEGHLIEDEQQILLDYCCPQIEDYSYGWKREEIETTDNNKNILDEGGLITDNYGTKWSLGGLHSEVVIVPDWMLELNGNIFICGAFDGECIEDLEKALQGANKKYKRINELIT